ncbi:hypothetical protein ABIF57_001057 [Bradyrhizobium diazoefficiens]
MICAQMIAISGGLGLLVPPLTSTLLGSVEKARSGIAAGVLNATRQTGSVLGVALFGSLVASEGAFMTGPARIAGGIGHSPAARRRRNRDRRAFAKMNNVSKRTHLPFTIAEPST